MSATKRGAPNQTIGAGRNTQAGWAKGQLPVAMQNQQTRGQQQTSNSQYGKGTAAGMRQNSQNKGREMAGQAFGIPS